MKMKENVFKNTQYVVPDYSQKYSFTDFEK